MSPGEHNICVELFVNLTRIEECVGYSNIDAYLTQQSDVWALVSVFVIPTRSSY